MQKLDLKKDLKYLYAPSARDAALVDVPEFGFLMVDGAVEPGEEPGTSSAFQQAVGALYGVAYTLKFASKQRADDPIDYPVMPLQGLWWSDAGEFDLARKDDWRWTLMILQPECITEAMVAAAIERVRRKGENPALSRLRLERYREGLCVQVMHVGPYSEEPATIERLRAFARENGCTLCGKHHEIYLGDPRRADPSKLKTVLRHPVAKP